MRNFILISALCALTSVSFADDLIVTSGLTKSQNAISLDLLSSGVAAGVQINIPVNGNGTKVVADLSGLKSSPTGNFTIGSNFNGQEIIIVVANDNNATMSKGQVSLGTIRLSGGTFGEPKLIVADAKAEIIQSSVRSN